MAQAMKGVSRAMMNMNKQMNMPQIQQILHEFEKQSEIMDMKEEMINDAIDDAMEDEGDEEESDGIVAQVLDELGLQLNDQLSGLPQVSEVRSNYELSTYRTNFRLPVHCQFLVLSNLKQLLSELVEGLSVGAAEAERQLQLQSLMQMTNFKSALITYDVNKLTPNHFTYVILFTCKTLSVDESTLTLNVTLNLILK